MSAASNRRLRSGHLDARQRELHPGELAHILLAVVDLGLEARARGQCLGCDLRNRLRFELAAEALEFQVSHAAQPARSTRALIVEVRACASPRARMRSLTAAANHAQTGHDAGCHSLGVALVALTQLAGSWNARDSQGLIVEAFALAVEAIELRSDWSQAFAKETVTYFVTRRITQVVPVAGRARALAARKRKSAPLRQKRSRAD